MGMPTGKDVVGIALQTAKGSLAAAPEFSHGIAGGKVDVSPNQEPDALTSAKLAPANALRDKVENGGEYQTRAFKKSVALYLYGALGDIESTGALAPYTHTIELGDDVPYLSVFSEKGDGTILAVRDCKVDELELSWEENKPVVLSVKMPGGKASFPAVFEADEEEVDSADYFRPVGGTFKLDVDSAVPATVSTRGGKVLIKRSAEPQYFSGDIEAGAVDEGNCMAEVSLTVVPDDLEMWRTIVTGSADGASVQTEPEYGSFEITFVMGTNSLKLSAGRVEFLCDLPEGNPEGGAAEIELSGRCYLSGDTPITAVVVNDHARYASEPGGSEE